MKINPSSLNRWAATLLMILSVVLAFMALRPEGLAVRESFMAVFTLLMAIAIKPETRR